jgi:Tol biopolymer transport system component
MFIEAGGVFMFKLRHYIEIFFFVLLTSCAPVETNLPTTPPIAPTITLMPTMTPIAQTMALMPPTPTSLLPTSMPPLPTENVSGLIAYTSDQDGDFEIWVMNADGSNQQKLTDNNAMDWSPAWSPDGNQIAFITNRDGNDEVYVMNADGSNIRRLTQSTEASEGFPAWSPDGMQISFDSDRDGNWDIYVMTSDGADLRRLISSPGDDWISSWSPDGSKIVFESKRDGNYEIYMIDSDGSDQRRLTVNQTHDGFPTWSPNGMQIAFISRRDGNYEIYSMNADGTNQQRVTNNPAEDSDPAWSPNGEWLTFVSQRDGNDEIYIMKANGNSTRQLTNNRAQNWSPTWQPSVVPIIRSNTWFRKFEGPNYGAFLDIVLTQDGSILAVGATNHLHMPPYSGDALFMKLTLEGDVLWEGTWGGDGYEQADSAVLAGDGGYYIFGETDSYGAGNRDFFLLKITQGGTDEWFKTYGGEGREWPYGMLLLSNGELLIYGFTESTNGGRDAYAIRVTPDGRIIWEYTVEIPGEELVLDSLETPEGDLVLAVSVDEDGGLVKLASDGSLKWEYLYELPGWQYASQVALTEDGGFFLAGFLMSISPQQADTWLARCTSTGELDWETAFGDPAFDDYATSMIRLRDGTYLIGAIANGVLLSRVDEDGTVLWRQSLLEQQTVYGGMALIELEDGDYLVAGLIQLIGGRSYDAFLMRTNAEGQIGE